MTPGVFCFAPLPRALVLTRRMERRRLKMREWRKFRKSPFWGMTFGISQDESSLIVEELSW